MPNAGEFITKTLSKDEAAILQGMLGDIRLFNTRALADVLEKRAYLGEMSS